MTKNTNIDERSTAAASYILSFYKEIENLTHNYATYLNLIIELKTKYEDISKGLTDEDKAVLNQAVQMTRYTVHQSHIKYQSIKPHFKKTDQNKDKDLTKAYNQIKDTYIINTDNLEQYTLIMNQILLTEIVQNLLNTSQELLGDIYDAKSAN